jgi:hypothetical protein
MAKTAVEVTERPRLVSTRRQLGMTSYEYEKLEGIMSERDVALALNISKDTLRTLGIPHVKLTRSSHIYFPDEVVTWLRGRDRA